MLDRKSIVLQHKKRMHKLTNNKQIVRTKNADSMLPQCNEYDYRHHSVMSMTTGSFTSTCSLVLHGVTVSPIYCGSSRAYFA